jgi:hypothetical protein
MPTCVTKTTVKAAFLLALAAGAASAQPAATVARGRPVEFETSLRAFGKSARWEPMGELVGRLQFEGRQIHRSMMLGTYRKNAAWLKTGAFVRFQAGMRHDDDWVKSPRGLWQWRDTSDRTETVLVLDASPRVKFAGSWLGLLKTRLEHNTFNGLSLAKLQPELSWFKMRGLEPAAHVSLRYEADLRLGGRGRALVREQWVYLSALKHFPNGFLVGPNAALREGVFEESGAFKAASNGRTYSARWRSYVLGLTAVKRFGRP